MNAKRLFEDDDVLFADPSNVRDSHVELRIDRDEEPASTEREIAPAESYFLRVPRLAMTSEELTLLPLDHREGFVLSRVDGKTTIETILDVSAMSAEEALEILESLTARGVIAIR